MVEGESEILVHLTLLTVDKLSIKVADDTPRLTPAVEYSRATPLLVVVPIEDPLVLVEIPTVVNVENPRGAVATHLHRTFVHPHL